MDLFSYLTELFKDVIESFSDLFSDDVTSQQHRRIIWRPHRIVKRRRDLTELFSDVLELFSDLTELFSDVIELLNDLIELFIELFNDLLGRIKRPHKNIKRPHGIAGHPYVKKFPLDLFLTLITRHSNTTLYVAVYSCACI